MFKKIVKTSVPALMAVTVLAACGSTETKSEDQKDSTASSSKESYKPDKLTVQFVPSQNAETLEAKAKPLEKLLKEELDIPVEVSVSTNYNTIVEAMKSKKVDVGFLPPTAYVLAHDQKAADVLLQAQRYGVNDDGTPTKELVDYYKSQFIVKKDSGIKNLKDMKDKKIAMQDVTSTAGYVFPAVELKKEGIDPLKDMEVTTVKGHDQAVISLLNDDVDVAVTFQDARNIVKGDQPNVFKDTEIVKFTEKIPNDTISVRSDMSKEWKDKLTEAFINIGKDKEGQKVIREVYSHEGYVKSDDSKFDIIREYDKKVKE
ncbi:phosphate/phosphite/phosphonate ABC transporter substrate-binding protein [Macrococcus lamae]|uniref:Phosphate/phosphite/phosphonate ABC transporter substrate-binding protein n=1 Tax=Macrococcus lamae TaxID=198484 RepID=A0A4V6PPS4_9STAP|nr:phosphate/phosphite/phosphonate ABC transporter substrate-binding protein [Macrococcus lamae]TDM10477.1 phosphate/phosphite/phosphonate ABC transporter substrate-binding protein [Macrococcus lamae]